MFICSNSKMMTTETEIDKAAWLPTLITDAIRKGCECPVANLFAALPASKEKQEIERKLERLLHDHTVHTPGHDITKMQENVRFTMNRPRFVLTFLNIGKKYERKSYSFSTILEARKELFNWLKSNSGLLYEKRYYEQENSLSKQMEKLTEVHIKEHDWELTFSNNELIISCTCGSTNMTYKDLISMNRAIDVIM